MTIVALRLLLALVIPEASADVRHEIAHRMCEVSVYAIAAPDVEDDEITDTGEAICEILCRNDPE